MLVTNKCTRCTHEWAQRNRFKSPKVCPKCKSPYWDRPRKNRVPRKFHFGYKVKETEYD